MRFSVGGVSVQGTYHNVNQDAYKCAAFENGYAVALSDGLGSCSMSHYGSRAFCDCAIELVDKYSCNIEDMNQFIKELHQSWLNELNDYDIHECYCTALLVVVKQGRFFAFHLGDGVMVIEADDEFIVMNEEKDGDFSNYTEAMTENLVLDKWMMRTSSFNHLNGIYLSSDGVELADMSDQGAADVAHHLICECSGQNVEDIQNELTHQLQDWPSSDDKTIAFLVRKEAVNYGE